MMTNETINNLLDTVAGYTYCTRGKLETLIKLCQYVNANQVLGDFVECGTCKGGSAAVLSKFMENRRHLWIYDSFQGMPETTSKDGDEAKDWVGKCHALPDDVREIMARVQTHDSDYTIKEGWFKESFQAETPKKVSLLHCDADWYESTMLALQTYYDLIPIGGCIILDDFGYWEGCREAFYDFCSQRGEKPLLERVECDQAYWIKGKTHNRPENR